MHRITEGTSEDDPGRVRYLVVLLALVGLLAGGAWLLSRVPPAVQVSPTVRVPGGNLPVEAAGSAAPVHIRTLEVDRTEVTVGAYRECVSAGSCKQPVSFLSPECNWQSPERASHPMNCVTVAEAIDYCQWRGARLPTTNEWRYLTHGASGRKYAWGDEPPDDARLSTSLSATAPVGASPKGATPEGLLDMAGNVAEWACDLAPDDEHQDDVLCWTFTAQGGSYRGEQTLPIRGGTPTLSSRWHDGAQSPDIGFRCVR